MMEWQAELDALLARIRRPSVELAPSSAGEAGPGGTDPREPPSAATDLDADPLWASPFLTAEDPSEDIEVSAVRTEIEATLRRVTELVGAGHIEPPLRADVVFVLYALTRPRPVAPVQRRLGRRRDVDAQESEDEWQLASAAAVLRFCRLVARLLDGATRARE